MNCETGPSPPEFEWSPAPRRDLFIAAALPVLMLLPFITKAFHIDDLVYIYVAQHVLDSPLDPYGFKLLTTWMHDITKNPPGHSYYLAVFGLVFGWSEPSMHFAMLLPTVTAALGVYFLARRLCGAPLFATCLCVATPGFLVSASNVMCEPLMLSCYLWAVVFWIRGLDEQRRAWLVWSVVVLTLGILTKFIVVTALPLLIAYTLLRERRVSGKLALLIGVPAVVMLAYDVGMHQLYGKSALLDAAGYSTAYSTGGSRLSLNSIAIGLTFVGGCSLTCLTAAIMGYRRKGVAAFAVAALVFALVTVALGGFDPRYTLYSMDGIRQGFLAQTALFGGAGLLLLGHTIVDTYRSRNAESALLLLLVFGMFVFTAGVNWTVNARSLLPMIPALAIVAVRHIERGGATSPPRSLQIAVVVCGVLLTTAVNYGDYRHSGDTRMAARAITERVGDDSVQVWFDGKSSFRYYMTQAGFDPILFDAMSDYQLGDTFALSDLGIERGDIIVIYVSQQTFSVPDRYLSSSDEIEVGRNTVITSMNTPVGAGFYDAHQGPLPYYFGPKPTETCLVYVAR